MNVKELEKLATRIEQLPRAQFDMDEWGTSNKWHVNEKIAADEACHTTCCIAGWHQVFKGRTIAGGYVYKNIKSFLDKEQSIGYTPDVAAEELDLNDEEQAKLFYDFFWPKKPNGKPMFALTPKGAAARIRYLIKTGE